VKFRIMKKADITFNEDDHAYMKMALDLSRRGLGATQPNPSVGCVIVKNNHVISRGWTGIGGRPHAETIALSRTDDAEGSTVYVSLEPCSHHGKTPPCADALIQANVAKVIIAARDPDPRVSGEGIKMLEQAGIDVGFGLLKEDANLIHQGFFQKTEQSRPLVTVKIASSKDGKIAKAEGEKNWVTCPVSRRRGHLYRANHDAIMVGIGTALIDDPSLDCRTPGLEDRSPIRVVLDTDLRISVNSKLCKSATEIPLWIMTNSVDKEKYAELEKYGVKIFRVEKNKAGQLELEQVMKILAEQGITRLLSEGGAQLNASLIRASLVDRLIWFKSDLTIGENGVNALYGIPINDLDQHLNLSLLNEGTSGSDHWQEFKILR
jgi:diaminohydroxyphosphoribosylaminopyrimidine deaminase / 5-amino-6-(5-phosphoribosylamino)uracil reductase